MRENDRDREVETQGEKERGGRGGRREGERRKEG